MRFKCNNFTAYYESSEFTKRLVYYPGYRGFFQRSNAELCLSPTKIDGFPQAGTCVRGCCKHSRDESSLCNGTSVYGFLLTWLNSPYIHFLVLFT